MDRLMHHGAVSISCGTVISTVPGLGTDCVPGILPGGQWRMGCRDEIFLLEAAPRHASRTIL